jgi:hypothetical protein
MEMSAFLQASVHTRALGAVVLLGWLVQVACKTRLRCVQEKAFCLADNMNLHFRITPSNA